MLDWADCGIVERIQGKVSGAWVFKGTRTPVAVVFENLEDGMTIDEVIEQFPVTREQVRAVLEFAAKAAPHNCFILIRKETLQTNGNRFPNAWTIMGI